MTRRVIFRLRRATTAEWQRRDPILRDGEQVLDLTTRKMKVGDGTSKWSELDYMGGGSGGVGPQGPKGDAGPAGPAAGSVFAIWAEENSGLGNNTTEWAFGNGANTPSNQGVVVPMACELFAGTLCLRQGTASVGIYKNGTLEATVEQAVAASPGYVSLTLGTPVAFAPGDCVGFRTVASAGTNGPNTVTAWMRTT